MEIIVRGLNLGVTAEVRAYAERRLEFALGRFAQRIDRIEVRLSDTNGHKGGPDKRCQVHVRTRNMSPLWVDTTHIDVLGAIDRSADRIGQVVARELGRGRGPMRASGDRWLLSLADYERLPEEAVG